MWMPESLYNAGVDLKDFQRCVRDDGLFIPDRKLVKKYNKELLKTYKPPVRFVVVDMWETFWFSIVNIVKRLLG